ncbi:MAG: hybrid sensor histidine kinase/response regulator [Candidatus Sericytochromatia bacterium]|nr:hybrid sensor histidine kinase/response regulator [Candidatus Sericytochromatia bacterium]
MEAKFLPHILVVDDVATNIRLVASILAEQSYELSFATSGKDALQQIQAQAFDLILLDLMMPGLSGLDVTRQLKQDERYASVPIVFITARSDEGAILEAFEAGAADYVTKPFLASELLARVQTQLNLKETRDQLQERNQELNQNVQLKNQLLSIASHDLKNPLSVINGFAQLLQNRPGIQTDPDAREMLKYISQAALRMNNLIEELLDTAALELGKMTLRCETMSLAPIMEKLLKGFQQPLAKKRQQLACQGDFETRIWGDPARIEQVIENLISNAIKYSPEEAQLRVDVQNREGWLELRVHDQGPGFSAEDQSRLFGYFQRLSAQPTGGEVSTGVGLAVVKQIVELHAGEILLEKTSQKGSTFLVRLPAQATAQA